MPDDAAMARAIGAKWARINLQCYPTAQWPNSTVEHAWGNGLRTIGVMTASTADLPLLLADGLNDFCDNVLWLLDYHGKQIGAIEILGAVEGLYVNGYGGAREWYGDFLRAAAETIKAKRPDATVLGGGFGTNAQPRFLTDCILPGAAVLDGYSVHPLAAPLHELDEFAELYAANLQGVRDAIEEGTPLWATVFGVPTVPEPYDEDTGRAVLPGDVMAIAADEALAWYTRLLTELEAAGVEVCCLLSRDLAHYKTPAAWCGLRYADGRDKPWTQSLLLWLQERPQAQVLIDLPEEDADADRA